MEMLISIYVLPQRVAYSHALWTRVWTGSLTAVLETPPIQELSRDLVPICKQKKSLWYLLWYRFILIFQSSTRGSCMFPVAQALDVSEVNDFAFSFYDRGIASHINRT